MHISRHLANCRLGTNTCEEERNEEVKSVLYPVLFRQMKRMCTTRREKLESTWSTLLGKDESDISNWFIRGKNLSLSVPALIVLSSSVASRYTLSLLSESRLCLCQGKMPHSECMDFIPKENIEEARW